MESITITVSVPHKSLSPNARSHWRTKHKNFQKGKEAAQYTTIKALEGLVPPRWDSATITVKAFFKDRRSKWDRGNFIGALKAVEDGIAAAGVVSNDRGNHWGEVDLSGIDKDNPRVELTYIGGP